MRILAVSLLFAYAPALAADSPAAAAASAASAGSLLQVLFGLVVVLALMAGAAWLMRRMGVAGTHSHSIAKVIGGVAVGNRERVVVVEVADQWIVVGVAPGHVTALQTMPRQDIPTQLHAPTEASSFSAWLKHTMEKRNSR